MVSVRATEYASRVSGMSVVVAFPGQPIFLQRSIFGLPARIVRLKGYDPEFSKYTKPEDR
jgi:hypothetical protein